jgi:membrane protein required for colicin V production
MWIDVLFLIALLIGIIRGWKSGIIISLFVSAAWVLGIIGALKLCGGAAAVIRDQFRIESAYVPVVAFIGVFLLISLVVYLIGKSLEKVVEVAQMGFLNKFMGVVFQASVFLVILSLFIWLVNGVGLIAPEVKNASKSFSLLNSVSTHCIELSEKYLPAVKEVFREIEEFFENVSEQVPETV